MSSLPANKKNLYFIIPLAVLILLVAIWLWTASPDTVFRIIRYNVSGIDDYKIFPSRPLQASAAPFHFVEGGDESRLPQTVPLDDGGEMPLEERLESSDTVAFLVIQEDMILFERYYQGYNADTVSLSFSMAKSILSILIGCAIDDGYIASVDQPVTDFVPELAQNGYDRVRLEHLLQMTSGMAYTENDNPFGIHPRFYYTAHLEKELLKLKLRGEPGQEYTYKSGENALLGLILTRALGGQTITDYAQERLWEPMGMEHDGAWSIDHPGDGLEKTWCCLSATARDYAKLGRLYLDHGNWNGEQIVSPGWVEQSTKIDASQGSVWNYQYQWWLMADESGDYMAIGHLGQYIYISPENRAIIVRLGKSEGGLDHVAWTEMMQFIASELN